MTNQLLIQATTWMNLKHMMVTERSQMQKTMYYMILFGDILEKAKLQRQKNDDKLPGTRDKKKIWLHEGTEL